MYKITKKYIILVSITILCSVLCCSEVDSLDSNDNDAWKISLLPFAYNIPSMGQLHNNKPLKAISLTAMKAYWYNEYNESKKENDISDRNRAFWWFSFLYFYSIIDAYIDSQMETFPEENENNNGENK